jgi:F0F1-type ATP synthase alpha subunit
MGGHFDHTEVNAAGKIKEQYLEYIGKLHEDDVLKPIRETGELKPNVEEKLKEAIENFKATNQSS